MVTAYYVPFNGYKVTEDVGPPANAESLMNYIRENPLLLQWLTESKITKWFEIRLSLQWSFLKKLTKRLSLPIATLVTERINWVGENAKIAKARRSPYFNVLTEADYTVCQHLCRTWSDSWIWNTTPPHAGFHQQLSVHLIKPWCSCVWLVRMNCYQAWCLLAEIIDEYRSRGSKKLWQMVLIKAWWNLQTTTWLILWKTCHLCYPFGVGLKSKIMDKFNHCKRLNQFNNTDILGVRQKTRLEQHTADGSWKWSNSKCRTYQTHLKYVDDSMVCYYP